MPAQPARIVATNAAAAAVLAPRLPDVEPQPAEPQERGPQRGQCKVVWVKVFVIQSLPLTQHQCAAQGRQPRREVNYQPATEVERAQVPDPALGAPYPVRHRVVDEGRP